MHAAAVALAVQPRLAATAMVIVQGDTSSALGGALAGSRAGVPVAHVEAGLRSHDSRFPWPEEDFRIEIDRLAALLLAPTELSAANLRRDKVTGVIHVTGNTAIDAAVARPVHRARVRDGGRQRLLVTCHRRESWGDGLASIAAALIEIAGRGGVQIRFVLHPNPHVAAAMEQRLGGDPNIVLQPPCSHGAMLEAMLHSDLVLTDSGGLQEEAPALGVPLLVLRDRTERPEAIATGNIALIGTGTERIVGAVLGLLEDPARLARMRRPAFPYGDGCAGQRIAAVVADWLSIPSRSRAA